MRPIRQGSLTLEAVVAVSLLALVATSVGPLVVRLGGLRTEHRAYRQAVDALSNELDRLATLPSNELDAALRTIDSELPVGAVIDASIDEAEQGRRITLTLRWPDHAHRRPPVTLVGWSFAEEPR